MLRRTFGDKRQEVRGQWRKLHNEVLHKFYSSADTIRAITSGMRWAENAAHMGEMRNGYIIMVGKPEGKRLLGRPRHRWRGSNGS